MKQELKEILINDLFEEMNKAQDHIKNECYTLANNNLKMVNKLLYYINYL